VTDGSSLDIDNTGQQDTEPGRLERDSYPVIDKADGVVLYEDRALRVLLLEEPLGLRLIGQADLSHRAAIEQALRRTERGVSDVLVDLTELEFIDVGGVRQLIDHAGVLGIDGRSVRITGARLGILRIFHVCFSPKPPNLCIDGANGRDPARARGVPLGQ
jgi:anti-anti-sigma regulatory factor